MLPPDPEMLSFFVQEARGYLPALRQAVERLHDASPLEDGGEEAYRHLHTIRGAASMVGVPDLAELADRCGAALEAIRAGQGDDDNRAILTDGVGMIAEYLDGLDGTPSTAPSDETPSDIAPELREVFALEAEDHLRAITSNLPLLETDPGNKEALQEIRRAAHTLKGAAGMVGFMPITQLTHRMEDLLDRLYEKAEPATPDAIRLLFDSTDALEDLAGGGGDRAVLFTVYRRYDSLMGATSVPAPPVPSAPKPKPGRLRPTGTSVRVPIERLDELVKLVGELVISRTAFEQKVADFQRLVVELEPGTERLRRVSARLERQYEASALTSDRGASFLAPTRNGSHPPLPVHAVHGFDDLEFDRYTEFHLVTRELAETTNDVQVIGGELHHFIGDSESYLTRQARLVGAIEDKLRRLRMLPLATLAGRLHRTVRNAAAGLDKQVELVLEGEQTELDKTVLEAMADPLLHLLRNAVDHGIEPPEQRVARGKPAQGTVRLHAYREGNQIVMRVADDGAGLDANRIRALAVERGLLSAAAAATASDSDLFALLFRPGFSTASTITEISGRGVGLDIVKANVQRLKGSVALSTSPGAGTVCTIRLPMTLAIARALLVTSRQQTFAIPLDAVRQIVRVERTAFDSLGQEPVVRLGERVYPLVSLDRALDLPDTSEEEIERPPVLVLHTGTREVALVVDRLLGGREVVVKSLGSHLRHVPGVAGATFSNDGGVVLILNPAELDRAPAPAMPAAVRLSLSTPAARTALIVDDSPSVRHVLTALLRRSGWQVSTARDGVEALDLLHRAARPPDLVLLDVEMPRMDGYELLASLRGQTNCLDIPVVMITSRAGDKHRAKALALGANAYLVKPYQDAQLLALIDKLTQSARNANEAVPC